MAPRYRLPRAITTHVDHHRIVTIGVRDRDTDGVMSPLATEWTVTQSGRPSWEIDGADEQIVGEVIAVLVDVLGCELVLPPVVGGDSIVAELTRDGHRLHVGWDIWSGFYVFADAEDGDGATREIAAWLEPRLGEPRFARCVR
jgi:hypothetical protein